MRACCEAPVPCRAWVTGPADGHGPHYKLGDPRCWFKSEAAVHSQRWPMLNNSLAAFGIVPPAPPPASRGGAPCQTPLDCQLNGPCTGGKCVCDAAWKGENCSVLNLLPAKPGQGYGQRGSSVSSWGAGVIRDPKTSKFYMHVAEMANNCGLGMWGVNSRCVLAESDTAGGPYTAVTTVVDAWCHGPSLGRDPKSGTWIFGHMGDGTKPRSKATLPGCRICKDGTTASGNDTLYPCPKGKGAVDSPMALTATSPTGPWQRAAYLENGANSEPFFLPNGTANCNLNANYLWSFRLKMHRWWRTAPEK